LVSLLRSEVGKHIFEAVLAVSLFTRQAFRTINNAEVLMATRAPYSVVLTNAEDRTMMTVHALDPAKLAPLVSGKLEMPILLDDFNFKLDGDFARRLGGMVLLTLASGSKFLKNHLSIRTQLDPGARD
jgi:hypothetical protein